MRAGERLGRYEILGLLGEGGQGRVYRARHQGPGGDRVVALKIVDRAEELRREARLGGLLRHPHLVDVYEVGEHDGTWFLAMELCDGGSLAERIPLPPRAVIDVGLAVCSALGCAYAELDLVHQDLKPQNLLLSGAVVKVADLGIARSIEGGTTRRVAGTPAYMAPEVRAGRAVDARADIWSLGIVLHELATGRASSHSRTFELDADLATEAPDLHGVAWLDPVLERCLAPDPDDRFATMEALAEALNALDAAGPPLVEWLGVTAPPTAREDGPLVGRADELAQLRRALAEPGVVTLKGPAGIGKSRLASAWAAETRARTVRCDLAHARAPLDVISALAAALEVPLGGGDEATLTEALGRALATRGEALVVVDHFDHVVAHAPLLAGLAERAPGARLLATSRQPLGVPGERVIDVDPLPEADAISLLVRAAAARGVAIDPTDADVVALARRLDGIPLALELAAGRLGVLSVADVLERLSVSFLRSGCAGLTDREATLEGALRWSLGLLDPVERAAFDQLAVFRGAFDLDAARAVVDALDVAEVVARLVARSVLVRRGARFAMLEVVRELASPPPQAEVRHGRHFAARGAPEALDRLDLHGGTRLRRALADDLDDLVAAARRAVARGDASVAAGAANAAWSVFELRGPFRLGLELLEAARSVAPDAIELAASHAWALRCAGQLDRALAVVSSLPPDHLRAQVIRGAVLQDQGRPAEAQRWHEAALANARQVGDRRSEGVVLVNLAVVSHQQGRPDDARTLTEQALAAHREIGNMRVEAMTLNNLGHMLLRRQLRDEARRCYERALALHRQVGNRAGEASAHGGLANSYLAGPDREQALPHFQRALKLHRELGHARAEGIVIGNLALLLDDLGRLDEARAAYERAIEMARAVGDRLSLANALNNLGALEIVKRDADRARALLVEAQQIHERAGSVAPLGKVHLALARLEILEGDPQAARRHADLALELARRHDDADLEERILALFADLRSG